MMIQTDSADVHLQQKQVTHHKKSFNVARIIEQLPEGATPAQQDSAVQAHLPERPQFRSACPDTLEIPGIPTKRSAFQQGHMPLYYQQNFFSDNKFYHPEVSDDKLGFYSEPLPYLMRHDDVMSLVLLLSFSVLLMILARSRKFLLLQLKSLFYPPREHDNLFNEETASEKRSMFLLKTETILISVLLTFAVTYAVAPIEVYDLSPYCVFGIYAILFLAYFLLKFFVYRFVNWTFFDKMSRKKWSETFDFLYASQGIWLFPLLLVIVYFHLDIYYVLIYLGVYCLFSKISLLYKSYSIFFAKKHGILHLIVYFCALEIVPLVLLWRALVFININFSVKI